MGIHSKTRMNRAHITQLTQGIGYNSFISEREFHETASDILLPIVMLDKESKFLNMYLKTRLCKANKNTRLTEKVMIYFCQN